MNGDRNNKTKYQIKRVYILDICYTFRIELLIIRRSSFCVLLFALALPLRPTFYPPSRSVPPSIPLRSRRARGGHHPSRRRAASS